jgi:flavin reductase (DIM6/NTAB) family NADH-FMN oxidoreductase RutF
MDELAAATTFRDAMAEVCSPVTVVTTVHEGRPHGMVTVALDHSSDLLAKVRQSGRLGVNVLGIGQDDLAVAFARKGVDKFAGIGWRLDHGLPRLDRTVVWLECDVTDVAAGGDHVVILAGVRTVSVAPAAPLTYHRRSFGTHAVDLPTATAS